MFLRDTIFNNVNNLLFHFSDDISKYEFDQVFNDSIAISQKMETLMENFIIREKWLFQSIQDIDIFILFKDYRAKNAGIQKYRLKLI